MHELISFLGRQATMDNYFLSCDWGTSSLRLRLADTIDGRIVVELHSPEGIARVFGQWQQSGLAEDNKTEFYLSVIDRQVKLLEQQTNQTLNGLLLLVSGMASSSIGFIDLPYASMPLGLDGAGMITAFIAGDDEFEHDTLVISGAKTENDVMRGEETQLIGCFAPGQKIKNELFIFPGTHSKHITVKESQAASLKTFMTGEVFSLLTEHSILKNAIQPGDFDEDAFKRGVNDSTARDLLHLIFKVRTNGLFDICSSSENYHYLSGLLIGSELADPVSTNAEKINLVCGDDLRLPYQIALNELLPGKKLDVFSAQRADGATVKGQLVVAKYLKLL